MRRGAEKEEGLWSSEGEIITARVRVLVCVCVACMKKGVQREREERGDEREDEGEKRAAAPYSQTRKFQKALDYVMSRA